MELVLFSIQDKEKRGWAHLISIFEWHESILEAGIVFVVSLFPITTHYLNDTPSVHGADADGHEPYIRYRDA